MGATLDLGPAAKMALISKIAAAIQAAVAEERERLARVHDRCTCLRSLGEYSPNLGKHRPIFSGALQHRSTNVSRLHLLPFTLATDYPSRRWDLASPRRDSRRRRREDPRPSKQGRPAPKPNRHADRSETSTAKPSIDLNDWALDARPRASRTSSDHCDPMLARCWVPDRRQLPLSSILPDQRVQLPGSLEPMLRPTSIRERAI